MFTLNVRKLFRNTIDSWQTAPLPRRKSRATFRPNLEALEARYCPAGTDLWVAPGGVNAPAANWAVGTNWSQGVPPGNTYNALFDPTATENGKTGTSTPCEVLAGANLAIVPSLTINNWGGTLTLQSNLAASAVTINPRTVNPGQLEIIINSGSNLYALQSLTWSGGNVSGGGNFEVGGTDTINGTSSTDQPTLGTRMDIGTTYLGNDYKGALTFSETSQPLVVNQSADIYVNNNSQLLLDNKPLAGQTAATAISNGDTAVHSITVNEGGLLDRANVCELFVGTGLIVNGGTVVVTNPQGVNTGNPLHFTRTTTSGGTGLQVNSGSVQFAGDFTSDYGGGFGGGSVQVSSGSKLTLGINANSTASSETGGTINLQGTLVSHGGFTMYGGTLGTFGSLKSVVQMDAGNTFYLIGGELDITFAGLPPDSVGKLEVKGNFVADGGTIFDAVNSGNGKFGVLQVDGNATLYPYTTFTSIDVSSPPPNFSKNWDLMTVGGTRMGDFFYNLPTIKWKADWNGGTLTIQENT